MRGLLRFLIGRRLARFLPGGWLVYLLTSPRVRGYLMRLIRRRFGSRGL